MSLAEKALQLRLEAACAARVAGFWEKQIQLYGEQKATAFYTSLGLNHLEKKSVEWEGLTLSREPSEVEKLCVKSISSAQDAGKASVSAILLKARTELIDEALKAIKKLTPASYHELVLNVPDKLKNELRDQLGKVFVKGKKLVALELSQQQGKAWFGELATKQFVSTEDDDAELDDLTDLTDSRVANEVQSRVTAAAARYALLNLTGAALWKAVRDELDAGSISYIDRASQGVANRVLNFGRSREAEDRSDEWNLVEYSALLDANCCGPCSADDGQQANSEADLTDTPNPDCEGGDWCRCFHVWIIEGVM